MANTRLDLCYGREEEYSKNTSEEFDIKAIMNKYRESKISGNKFLRNDALEKLTKMMDKFIIYKINTSFKSMKGLYFEDMLQEGRMAILQSVDKYNEERTTPTTYFYPFIIHALTVFMNGINGISSHYGSEINKLNKAEKELKELGIEINTQNLAQKSGLSEKCVNQTLDLKDKVLLQYANGEDEYDALMGQHIDSPEKAIEEKMEKELIYEKMQSVLTEEERIIIASKYGIGCQAMKNKEISDTFNISLDRIRKLQHTAIRKLRVNGSMKKMFVDNIKQAENMLNDISVSLIPVDSANQTEKELTDGLEEENLILMDYSNINIETACVNFAV